jgi:hypothetical protein
MRFHCARSRQVTFLPKLTVPLKVCRWTSCGVGVTTVHTALEEGDPWVTGKIDILCAIGLLVAIIRPQYLDLVLNLHFEKHSPVGIPERIYTTQHTRWQKVYLAEVGNTGLSRDSICGLANIHKQDPERRPTCCQCARVAGNPASSQQKQVWMHGGGIPVANGDSVVTACGMAPHYVALIYPPCAGQHAMYREAGIWIDQSNRLRAILASKAAGRWIRNSIRFM